MQAVIVKMVKMMQKNSKSQQRRQILCDIEN